MHPNLDSKSSHIPGSYVALGIEENKLQYVMSETKESYIPVQQKVL